MGKTQVTWKDVIDRGCLGAYRGQGILVRELNKLLEEEGLIKKEKMKKKRTTQEPTATWEDKVKRDCLGPFRGQGLFIKGLNEKFGKRSNRTSSGLMR